MTDLIEIQNKIIQLLESKKRSIRIERGASVFRIRFDNEKQVVLKFDFESQTKKIYSACEMESMEYEYVHTQWTSKINNSEFFADLSKNIDALLPVQDSSEAGLSLEYIATNKAIVSKESREMGVLLKLSVLVFVVALAFLVYSATKQNPETKPVDNSTPAIQMENSSPQKSVNRCDISPPVNAFVRNVPENRINNGNQLSLEISNKHVFDLLIQLVPENSILPAHSIYVRANSLALINVASDNYDLIISAGKRWCSIDQGFSDGIQRRLQNTVAFHANTPSALTIQSFGVNAEDFKLYIRNEAIVEPDKTQQTTLSDGTMQLQQASDGHYYVHGFINYEAVNFLLDTGASRTLIRNDVALRAGIKDCQPASFITANGKVAGCIGVIPELKFGPFVVNNAVVSTTPSNNEVNLLGMDILGKLQVTSSNGKMQISK